MSGRKPRHFFEWLRAIRDRRDRLTMAEFAVALAIASHANEKFECWPSVPAIARVAGCSVRTVQKALPSLEAMGWLRRINKSKGGLAHTYSLSIPTDGAGAAPLIPADGAGAAPSDGAAAAPSSAIMVQDLHRNGAGAAGEVTQRSSSSSRSRRTRAAADTTEPQAFKTLLDGIKLHGPGRTEILHSWRDDPERVEAVVSEWRDRDRAGPGVLVLMVRDERSVNEDDRPF